MNGHWGFIWVWFYKILFSGEMIFGKWDWVFTENENDNDNDRRQKTY